MGGSVEAVPGATRAEVCVVAVAECFRGDGERLCNPIGTIPMIGGRLARETFEPSLVMTDGFAMFTSSCLPPGVNPYRNVDGRLELDEVVESWNPYPQMFTVLWNGKRHVMMGASQIDRYGNQNIACIGDWHRPRAQLLGFRGAPGNTINHTTSYWVPNHNPKSFVEKVDVVSGVGYDRAAALGPRAARFHEIRRVVSNLGVFDFETPDHRMRVRSVHPGVSLEEVQEATGFELAVAEDLDETRLPTMEELRLIRDVIDPAGLRTTEVKN
ncbi:CoA-transferase subunit beta [Rhabdothermincola sediminis]|uniref:CoA-transferase subunit beta n=1 Tax=Rhabdothermincola sediminis TaxID=2751370 RepID=UPI001AA04C44|nr:CoA-transferase [Rhabdothermincola sediminis]